MSNASLKHLWMHFTPIPEEGSADVPVIVEAEGCYLRDQTGKRHLDALAGLFTVQVGYGRDSIMRSGFEQSQKLAYFPIWGAANEPAIALANKLAELAPSGLDHVFFGTGGGESVETAWKLARQYFKLRGMPGKTKAVVREQAYHGTTLGALSLTQVESMKSPFGPLVEQVVTVPNTHFYRNRLTDESEAEFGRRMAAAFEERVLREGPDTIALAYVEPVQNSGGVLVADQAYFAEVRRICDEHEILLVADETICGFGRLGSMFGSEAVGLEPDIITCAKGLTSGYAILSAMIVSTTIANVFQAENAVFAHGSTWGGHPVSAAVALENIRIIEDEKLVGRVRELSPSFRASLEELKEKPLVADVRGEGYFFGIEFSAASDPGTPLCSTEDGREIARRIAEKIKDSGVHLRAFSNNSSVIQLCPPLIAGEEEFEKIREVISGAIDFALQGRSMANSPEHE